MNMITFMVLYLSEKQDTYVNYLKLCINFVAVASPPLRLLSMLANTTCTCNPIRINAVFKSPDYYLLVGGIGMRFLLLEH